MEKKKVRVNSNKYNVYQVKLKVMPPKPYMSFFMQGVVLAKTEAAAVEKAINVTKDWAKNEVHNADVKLQSVSKLRNDFLIDARPTNDTSNEEAKTAHSS
ncbi:hypothetical protein R1T16_17355 [Flavobacterium sp. DG1-102-2]|uniref:hypothetical protein n=1 Tax=Flavobacterium sp. DG1-102-2 TaxID=3081663 RepID=UPI002949D39F|nr:hypothetical protein [Flavobacterium sp. DG1-102-2]MDV6170207.1 hypothetical protein [Flavobacterium sp. DG1-102-2]